MTNTQEQLTFGHLLARWADTRYDEWAPSTQRTNTSIAKRVTAHLGHIPLAELTTEDLDTYYHCLRAGRDEQGASVEPLAPSTTIRHHGLIAAALAQAERWDLIVRNPARRATPPTYRPSISAPTSEEVALALNAALATSPRLALYLRLAITTGARRGELCALRWSQVDSDRATLCISRAISVGPGQRLVVKAPKSGRTRTIALDLGTIAALAEHQQMQRDIAARKGVDLDQDPFVFTRHATGGAPWTPETATAAWSRLRRRLGLEHVRLHDLRHYAITMMLAGNIPVRTVSDRVGHASAAMTLGVYGHALPVQDHEAAALLAATLGSH